MMRRENGRKFQQLPKRLLRPVPVSLYRPILRHIVQRVAGRHKRLFARLGRHSAKFYLIKPTNLPFVLLLSPNPKNPQMVAYRSGEGLSYQASISGSFMNLFRLLDGRGDGDAIFFSRDLKIEGDTEAVVCLRNALDDVEGSIAGDIASLFGPLGSLGLSVLRHIEV